VSEGRLQKAREVLEFDGRPLVFFQISGPDATKQRFIDTVLRSTGALSKRYKVVVSMGYLGGSGEPKRLADGTLLYDWCPIKDELFALSHVLVARAGHRTIGQCIDAGKPAVLVSGGDSLDCVRPLFRKPGRRTARTRRGEPNVGHGLEPPRKVALDGRVPAR